MTHKSLKKLGQIVFIGMLCLGLGACVSLKATSPAIYDLGVAHIEPRQNGAELGNKDLIGIPGVLVSGAINNLNIIYRYTNVLTNEPRHYAQSRWAQHPAELFIFRAQQHLGGHYPVVVTSELESRDSWVIRFILEDFSQHISSESDSKGVVQVRATLMHGGKLVEQKMFYSEQPAATADAQGAASAISAATDDVLAQITRWVDAKIKTQALHP